MPWSDNGNDDNGKKKPLPWGQKPSTPPADFDDIITQTQQRFREFFNGDFNGGGNGKIILIVMLGSLFLWLFSGFYIVDPEEQAVITRFGKYHRTTDSGLNYHIPAPIEYAIKQKVTRIEREEIGFRSTGSLNTPGSSPQLQTRTATSQRNISEESLMLTGDENIVDINFDVQWKIRDIKDFLFNVYKPKDTVKSTAESAMREVIGNTPIAAALAEGRSSIEQRTKDLLQKTLDSYGAGVEIVRLQMLKVDPPAQVVDAFRDVQTARADKEREINQAQAYQNDIIPRARGDASRLVQEAEGYKQEVIARSKGEASRFLAVYEQYVNAKDVTKKRLYLETMEELLQGMDKIIVDNKGGQGVIPYLPLPQLTKKTAPATTKE
jgi:modulator of FtsH protease HflK